MEKKLQKMYPKYYNLLTAQDLWQGHYQILSIIFLKKFIKLNLNMGTMIKYVKLVELYTKYAITNRLQTFRLSQKLSTIFSMKN